MDSWQNMRKHVSINDLCVIAKFMTIKKAPNHRKNGLKAALLEGKSITITRRKHSFERAKGMLLQHKSYALTSEKDKNDGALGEKQRFNRCFLLSLKFF